MKRFLLLLTVIIFSSNLFSQIEGDWLTVYEYHENCNKEGFDTTKKIATHFGIFVIEKDSLYILSAKGRYKYNGVRSKYQLLNDSIYIIQDEKKTPIKISFSKDTIRLIDKKRTGEYIVMCKLKPPKEKYTIEELHKQLNDNSFTIDFSTIISIITENNAITIDTILFKKDNTYELNNNSGKWKVVKSNENIFLQIDKLLFQIYSINDKQIKLKSYFETEHFFELNLIKK